MTVGTPVSESVSAAVIDSVLESRIDQAVAITLPGDQSRIDLLQSIRRIESRPMRIASFTDYLIDHIATLSLELNQAQLQDESPKQRGRSRRSSFASNCERCLRMLKASRENLAISIAQMVDQNVRLRRRHSRDREMLLRQNQIIAQLTLARQPTPTTETVCGQRRSGDQ
jgi:chromosome condensin MukBEF ATPase and DNA-binding subunit MukB